MSTSLGGIYSVVDAYLERIGQNRVQELGEQRPEPSKEDQAFLIEGLRRTRRFNANIIIVAIIILCAIFLLGAFLVIYYRSAPQTMAMVFGGNFLSLLVIVAWLRRLWFEKSTLDLLTALLPSLPAADAAQVVTTWRFQSKSVRRGPASPDPATPAKVQ